MEDEKQKLFFASVNGKRADFSEFVETDYKAFLVIQSYGVKFELEYNEDIDETFVYCTNVEKRHVEPLSRIFIAFRDAFKVEMANKDKIKDIGLEKESSEMDKNGIVLQDIKDELVLDEVVDFLVKESKNYKDAIFFDIDHPNSVTKEVSSAEATVSSVISNLSINDQKKIKTLLEEYITNKNLAFFEKVYLEFVIKQLSNNISKGNKSQAPNL